MGSVWQRVNHRLEHRRTSLTPPRFVRLSLSAVADPVALQIRIDLERLGSRLVMLMEPAVGSPGPRAGAVAGIRYHPAERGRARGQSAREVLDCAIRGRVSEKDRFGISELTDAVFTMALPGFM
jgi:hypothetical protein